MKKIFVLFSSFLMLSSFLWAQPKPEWLNKGSLPLTKEKVTLKILAQSQPAVIDFNTNGYTKWLEGRTNIDLEFTTTPAETKAATEKLNLLIASGDYPEIILNKSIPLDSSAEARFGIEEKIFLPVTKYLTDPKIMPNFNAWLSKNPSARGNLAAVDGNIYGFPMISECFHCTLGQKFWINQDWLKKLGLKMPATTEEFYRVLKAFKEKDPNGNGKADEIPLLGATDSTNTQAEPFLMSAFVLDPGMTSKLKLIVDNNNNRVLSTLDQEGYKEGLKYISKLYKEGLYFNGSIIQKTDQAKQLIAADPTIVGVFPANYPGIMIDAVAQNKLWRQYVILPPLKGPNGYASTPLFADTVLQPNQIVFTKALKYPELAARFVDVMYSYEASVARTYGEEGKGWRWATKGESGLDGNLAIWKNLIPYKVEPQENSWLTIGPGQQTAEFRFGQVTEPGVDVGAPEGLETMLLQASKKMLPFVRKDVSILPNVKFTTVESEELQILRVELERYSENQRVSFIAGAQDIEKGWSQYVQKLRALGLPKLLGLYQIAYERRLKATN